MKTPWRSWPLGHLVIEAALLVYLVAVGLATCLLR